MEEIRKKIKELEQKKASAVAILEKIERELSAFLIVSESLGLNNLREEKPVEPLLLTPPLAEPPHCKKPRIERKKTHYPPEGFTQEVMVKKAKAGLKEKTCEECSLPFKPNSGIQKRCLFCRDGKKIKSSPYDLAVGINVTRGPEDSETVVRKMTPEERKKFGLPT